jgi:hypothetical protein
MDDNRQQHRWVHPVNPRGSRAGTPMRQRQCAVCGAWETDVSQGTSCPLPAG